MWELEIPNGAKPIGYRYLVEKYNIEAFSHYCWSYTGEKSVKRQLTIDSINLTLYFYPSTYQIEGGIFQHLEFALKQEGINLLILKNFFSRISKEDILRYITKTPTGKYSRKIWFLYEWLLDERLPLEDAQRGTYVELVNTNEYYCAFSQKSPRHRVTNNLLGNSLFCPIVRKSIKMQAFEKLDLKKEVSKLTQGFDTETLSRAMRYLYTKETMASWEIEREKPDKARLSRFVSLLEQGDQIGQLSKKMLVETQKIIVDPRFSLDDYRDFQNYVGEEPGLGKMIIHFISPKPEDLSKLMEGLLSCFYLMSKSTIHPVITAAVVSFSFVFFHPFWDGNGRLHRFLIHYVLSKSGLFPKGIVFPISAVMLRDQRSYDNALESFSKPLLELLTKYKVNDRGEMTVQQDTYDLYRYIDFTPIVEYFFSCVQQTIHTDFEEELHFLTQYDKIKQSFKRIVDMPDQKIDLFIKCARQNSGILSKRKRDNLFGMLTDEEISSLEAVMKKYSS